MYLYLCPFLKKKCIRIKPGDYRSVGMFVGQWFWHANVCVEVAKHTDHGAN